MKVQGKPLKTEKKVRRKRGNQVQVLWSWAREKDEEKNREEKKNYELVCSVFGVEKPYQFGASAVLKAQIETFARLLKEQGKLAVEM